MADEGKKPDWAPSWLPHGHSISYVASGLQLLILALAGSFLLYHLFKRNTNTAVGILGNQAT